jgi:hypothetical protein
LTTSLKQKIEEVEKATVAAIWRRPDTVVDVRPGWVQVFTPSSKQFWFNGVVKSTLKPNEAPRIVAETVEMYRKAGKHFRWNVGPSAAPANLDALLLREGLKDEYGCLGMVISVDALNAQPNPKVIVQRTTLATVPDYVKASVAGWNNTDEAAREMLVDLTRSLKDPNHRTLYFHAYLDGEPAASGALLPIETSGYLLGSSVVTKFRKQGVYQSLVAERIKVLRTMGIPLASILAMENTSAPICKKMGFETVCEIKAFICKNA